jgi:hypothetical protein
MANYYGQVRTNYFAVKDPEAFREDIMNYPVQMISQERDGEILFGFLDTDEGGLPVTTYNEETDEDTEIIWEDLFIKHLKDDWVAIILEVGSEKHRYFQGFASAYNNKGETVYLNLEDIYDLAAKLGGTITHASY